MVKFLLATCKERCEDGACWDRRVDAAHGSLLEELVEEGALEARTVACGTDSLLSGPLQCVPPVLGGRRLWVRGSASAGCCPRSGALPWDESLDHAASTSLHPLPVLR